jgi:ribose/xylose/arabinose/galactoside ABC-type transport system permease subunit
MPALLSVVGSAITLALGVVVAFTFFFGDDGEFDLFTEDFFITMVASLALLAAPVALLLSWDEFDVSALGTTVLGMAIYAEMDGGFGPVLAAAFAGAVIGAVMGLARWLTRAPSGIVSLSGGAVASAIALQVFEGGMQGMRVDELDVMWVAIALMVVVVAVAAGLALLAPSLAGGSVAASTADASRGRPHVGVVLGFALSGLAGCVYGAVQPAFYGFAQPNFFSSYLLVALFAAVAVGGATRHSGLLAPVVTIPGAFLVTVLVTGRGGPFDSERDLALAGLLAATGMIAHGLARVSDRNDGRGTGAGPFAPPAPGAPQGAAFAGWSATPGVPTGPVGAGWAGTSGGPSGPPPATPSWSQPSLRPPG